MTVSRALVLLLLVGIFVSMVYFSQTNNKLIIQPSNKTSDVQDAKNTTYIVDGRLITLKDGSSEIDLGEGGIISTKLFSSRLIGDINNDTYEDVVVILTQETSGTGIFYYVALAMGAGEVYHGTNSIFLGDRIAPQTEEYKKGIVIVNYVDREPGQSMSDEPSRGVSKYLTWEEDKLKELSFSHELISVFAPAPLSEIVSPLNIAGKARGYWFFEGSFLIVLTDWDGLIIAEGIATAQSDWMTEEFVPFEASLEFDTPIYGDSGSLIFKKDNPSGEADKDDALEFPIFF